MSEEAVAVSGSVSGITDRGVNDRYQQLQLMVDRLGFPLLNPMTDLLVTVEQNNDPTTLRTLTVPLRTEGQRMIYEHRNELILTQATSSAVLKPWLCRCPVCASTRRAITLTATLLS